MRRSRSSSAALKPAREPSPSVRADPSRPKGNSPAAAAAAVRGRSPGIHFIPNVGLLSTAGRAAGDAVGGRKGRPTPPRTPERPRRGLSAGGSPDGSPDAALRPARARPATSAALPTLQSLLASLPRSTFATSSTLPGSAPPKPLGLTPATDGVGPDGFLPESELSKLQQEVQLIEERLRQMDQTVAGPPPPTLPLPLTSSSLLSGATSPPAIPEMARWLPPALHSVLQPPSPGESPPAVPRIIGSSPLHATAAPPPAPAASPTLAMALAPSPTSAPVPATDSPGGRSPLAAAVPRAAAPPPPPAEAEEAPRAAAHKPRGRGPRPAWLPTSTKKRDDVRPTAAGAPPAPAASSPRTPAPQAAPSDGHAPHPPQRSASQGRPRKAVPPAEVHGELAAQVRLLQRRLAEEATERAALQRSHEAGQQRLAALEQEVKRWQETTTLTQQHFGEFRHTVAEQLAALQRQLQLQWQHQQQQHSLNAYFHHQLAPAGLPPPPQGAEASSSPAAVAAAVGLTPPGASPAAGPAPAPASTASPTGSWASLLRHPSGEEGSAACEEDAAGVEDPDCSPVRPTVQPRVVRNTLESFARLLRSPLPDLTALGTLSPGTTRLVEGDSSLDSVGPSPQGPSQHSSPADVLAARVLAVTQGSLQMPASSL